MRLCLSLIYAPKLAKLWPKCDSQQKWRLLFSSAIAAKTPNYHISKAENIAKILCQHNLDAETTLGNNKWLLTMKSDLLSEKLRLLSSIKISQDTIIFLKLTIKCINRIVAQWHADKEVPELQSHSKDRLEYISELLGCKISDLVGQIDKHFPILTLDFQKVVRVIKLLMANGVSKEDILKDLWIIRHNEDLIQQRLTKVTLAKVAIKTWMLRCPESVLNNHLQIEISERSVLGEHDGVVSYLAHRLQCSQEEIIEISKRKPHLLSVNPPKLKKVLDFVYENGFTADQVKNAPRVFSLSLETVKRRLHELNDLKFKPSNLHVLCSTVKEHQRLVSKITRNVGLFSKSR